MLEPRLRARCPSARLIGAASCAGHDIAFDKIGLDGSGKATLMGWAGGTVRGGLYQLDARDIEALDLFEGVGLGYDRIELEVTQGPRVHLAFTYQAGPRFRQPGLPVFDWYLDLVLAGARQLALPDAWIARLAAIEAEPDPLPDRDRRAEALALLSAIPAAWRRG